MKSFKRSALLLAIFLLVTTLLSGCGSKTVTPSASSSTSSPSTASTPEPLKPVKLTMMVGFANFEPIVKEIFATYKIDNPNVSLEILGSGSTDCNKTLQVMIATGSYPDISLISRGTGEQQYVTNDLLTDLTDRPVAKIMNDLNKKTHVISGKIYSVSTGVGIYGLIYNKDIFKNAGISNPPTTLTELKQVIATLKSKNIIPFMPQFKTDWAVGQFFQYGIDPILNENLALASDLAAGKAKMTDANSKILDVFQYIDLVRDNSGKNPFNFETFSNGVADFVKGNEAMSIQGDWLLPATITIDKTFTDKVGLIGIPWSDDATQNRLVVFYNDGYGMFKKSPNPIEATKFFDYFFNNANQDILAKGAGNASPMIGADNSFASKFVQDNFNTIQDPSKVYGDLEFGKLPATVTSAMNSSMQGYLAKGLTKAQALDQIQKAIDLGLANK